MQVTKFNKALQETAFGTSSPRLIDGIMLTKFDTIDDKVGAAVSIYVSSYYYICALILLCMCPHTTTYVSSYYYICVLILLLCPHTTICVLILLYMFPHTTICVLILLYMCPHTTGGSGRVDGVCHGSAGRLSRSRPDVYRSQKAQRPQYRQTPAPLMHI